jgi:hypothetical protein
VVSLPERVELNSVAREEMGIYLWVVHVSRIVGKKVELMGKVEQWALSSSLFPQLQ